MSLKRICTVTIGGILIEHHLFGPDLAGEVEEALDLGQLVPRLPDEPLAVHDVQLAQREERQPPPHVRSVNTLKWREIGINVELNPTG